MAIPDRSRPRPYARPPAAVTVRGSVGPGGSRAAGARRIGGRDPEQRPGGSAQSGARQVGAVAPTYARDRHAPDVVVLAIVLALTALGILMVFSSSAMKGYAAGDGTFATVGPQLVWAALGIGALLATMTLDFRWLRLVSLPLLLVAAVLLVLLYTPLGIEVGGSRQWLKLPAIPAIQPSEFVKLALVIYLAHWMARRGTAVRELRGGLLPFVAILAPFVLLIFRSPDIGSAGVLGIVGVVMFFVAGGNPLAIGALGLSALAAAAMFLKDYQLARLQAFADPFKVEQTTGYQTVQGLLALGLGGLFGAGLGDRAAAGGLALPNGHNDYIFAVVGQEFGFVGASVVVLAFVILAWRGVIIARSAPDTFGSLIAIGVTAWLCVQAFVNIGVVVALLPITGITLPFVSAGGSSLIVSLAAAGILLAVSRETVPSGGWVDASGDRGRRHGRAYLPGSRRRPLAARAPGRG